MALKQRDSGIGRGQIQPFGERRVKETALGREATWHRGYTERHFWTSEADKLLRFHFGLVFPAAVGSSSSCAQSQAHPDRSYGDYQRRGRQQCRGFWVRCGSGVGAAREVAGCAESAAEMEGPSTDAGGVVCLSGSDV